MSKNDKKDAKNIVKIDVEIFAQIALSLRDALEIMEDKLDEMGYSLDDFEVDGEYEEYEEECEEEEISKKKKK